MVFATRSLIFVWLAGAAAAHAQEPPTGTLRAPAPGSSSQRPATQLKLPTVVIEGSPADALSLDPIVPSQGGAIGPLAGGSGSIERTLSKDLALPLSDYGRPGYVTGVVGLGRSAEETGAQTLGVPLNYGSGGGFHLSMFPQYLWSAYRFQLGPTLGAYDPRASAGSLNLVPWTDAALREPATRYRVAQFFSDIGQYQISAAGQSAGEVAAVAGYSGGEAKGPSGMVSGRWGVGAVSGKYHLLATDVEAKSLGSKSRPTPGATLRTARVIPVLQADVPIGDALVKSSVYYDAAYTRYEEPLDPSARGRNHLSQAGTENALLAGDWRLGVSARHVTFSHLPGPVPYEDVFSGSVTRTLSFGRLMVEPTVQAVGITRYGLHPAGSLGARVEWPGLDGGTNAIFARGTHTKKFPSLIDRYFIDPTFIGNAGVTPEHDTTLAAGYEWRSRELDAVIEGYHQYRDNVLLPTFNGVRSVANAGTARVEALMVNLTAHPYSWWDIGQALTLTDSWVSSTGLGFPLLPGRSLRLSTDFHDPDQGKAWRTGASFRAASQTRVGSRSSVSGGYSLVDVHGGMRVLTLGRGPLAPAFELSAQVENLFDRRAEIVPDYPLPGRVYSMALTGMF